jgi:hypothetical protein
MSNVTMTRARVEEESDTPAISYVDWAAVVAGALISTAIFITMTTFGTGIGLSLTSPYLGEGASAKAAAIAVGIWTLWVVISSFLAGGYIAGRMRHRTYDATEHESEIRNGAQGLTSWALATLLGGILTAMLASGVVSHSGGTAPAGGTDHARFVADSLLRTERPGVFDEGLHHEVATVLQTGAYSGKLAAPDRAYLVNLVTQRGTPSSDAERRVDAAVTDIRETANDARKTGVLVAFLSAVALAIGAAASWWAATLGGKHRDENTGFNILTRWS